MATTSTSLSLSPPPIIPSISKPKPFHFLDTQRKRFPPFTSPPLDLSTSLSSTHLITKKSTKICRTNATSAEVSPPKSSPIDASQQIVSSTGDDTTNNIISLLLFIAFTALTILTIGVIYIGVTDFLQKREREKFEKEEAAKKKKKKSGKKVKVRARAGPRGFGQKIDDDEDDD